MPKKTLPSLITIFARIAPEKAKIEPTERSIPPVIMTKVMPAAIIALTEVCLKTLNIFPSVRNCVLNIATDNEKTIKKVSVGYFIKTLTYLFDNSLYLTLKAKLH